MKIHQHIKTARAAKRRMLMTASKMKSQSEKNFNAQVWKRFKKWGGGGTVHPNVKSNFSWQTTGWDSSQISFSSQKRFEQDRNKSGSVRPLPGRALEPVFERRVKVCGEKSVQKRWIGASKVSHGRFTREFSKWTGFRSLGSLKITQRKFPKERTPGPGVFLKKRSYRPSLVFDGRWLSQMNLAWECFYFASIDVFAPWKQSVTRTHLK